MWLWKLVKQSVRAVTFVSDTGLQVCWAGGRWTLNGKNLGQTRPVTSKWNCVCLSLLLLWIELCPTTPIHMLKS